MGKIKIIFFLIIAFIGYKGFVAFKNFEIGTSNKMAEIEEVAGIEKKKEVVGLLMYLGEPPKLIEHLYMESSTKCIELKAIAEENSNAIYECARLNAVLTGNKIVKVIDKLEVIQ